jgi:DNA polymerase III epsilon subunit-like protein
MCLILKKCKKKLGISIPIPFECREDETKCIKLTTWNRRLDTIDGFRGFQISLQHPIHQCKFDINTSAT